MSNHKWLFSRWSSASISLAVLSVAAFLTRLLPLCLSQYPFNNDALTESGIASDILSSHHLRFSPDAQWTMSHSIAIPILNVLIAFSSSVIGATPFSSAQVICAAIAASTVGVFFLLGKQFSGDVRGGVVAAFAAVLFGSFVFTTGSVWKMMLGINMLGFALLFYSRREQTRYLALTALVLLLLPFVHHLVTIVAFLLFANLLVWSWVFAFVNKLVSKRHVYDTLVIAIPGVIAAYYYSTVEFDRYIQFLTPIKIAALLVGFLVLTIIGSSILSMKRHLKWSLAPLVGIGVTALVLLDYLGLIFPYEPSAPPVFALLVLATGLIVAVAWFGSEVAVEHGNRYRAILVGLLISPIAVIGFGMLPGLSSASHQVLYRTFDLLDFFIFLGMGVGVAELARRRKGLYKLVGSALVLALVVSFPFGYASNSLLGVRHDTQAYEVDAMKWLEDRDSLVVLITDERLSYIAKATSTCLADASLPKFIGPNGFPEYRWYYLLERSWTTSGVNYYPHGLYVMPETTLDLALAASDVLYLGGPVSDQLIVFLPSDMGANTVFRNG